MLFPKDKFVQVGGFDESFFMNCEEIDLQRRLRALGVESFVLENVSVRHVGGASSKDDANRIAWLMESRMFYERKWRGSAWPLRGTLFVASFLNLLTNGVRLIFGRNVRPFQILQTELSYLKTKTS